MIKFLIEKEFKQLLRNSFLMGQKEGWGVLIYLLLLMIMQPSCVRNILQLLQSPVLSLR